MTTLKDIVRTNDYCAFCIESSETWKNLAKSLEGNKVKTTQAVPLTKWGVLTSWFKYKPLMITTDDFWDYRKQQVIQNRLDLLLTEYYRTQYYTMYEFSSIEIHPDLRDGFFSWCHDKLKSTMNIQ